MFGDITLSGMKNSLGRKVLNMKSHRLAVGLLILMTVLAVAGLKLTEGNAEVKTGIAVGNRAIDFELPDLEGKQVKLLETVGKNQVTVLNFWATWCPPCRAEIPDLNRFYEKYNRQQVMVLGVNLQEDPGQVKGFVKKNGMKFPVLTDTGGKIAKLYNVYAIPTTFVLDAKGVIQDKIEGSTTNKVLESKVKAVLKEQ